MDRTYGAEFRNEALRIARAEAEERGYSMVGGDVPDPSETMSLIEIGYLKAKMKTPSKPEETRTPARPKMDTGKTGSAAAPHPFKPGSMEEVKADMLKRGKFKLYRETS